MMHAQLPSQVPTRRAPHHRSPKRAPSRREALTLGGLALGSAALLSGCMPSTSPGAGGSAPDPATDMGISDQEYSLDALVDAARSEGPIRVVDATGKIVDMANAFTDTYGISATGVKMTVKDQEEVLLREAQAGNVLTDVYNIGDIPSVSAQFLPQGLLINWTPPDLVEALDDGSRSPLISVKNPLVWAYNTEAYGDQSPVDNMWALTEKEWSGRVAIEDPLLLTELCFWFNQMDTHHNEEMAAAYAAHFGKEFSSSEDLSPTREWVKHFAKNGPYLVQSDTDAAVSAGAPGQENPFIGFISSGKFRENESSGYNLGLCSGMTPWIGHVSDKAAMIAARTQNPNAAKLFVHFMLTQEGIQPQLEDGKLSTNREIEDYPEDPSHIRDHFDELHNSDQETAALDFANLTEWQDFWREHY